MSEKITTETLDKAYLEYSNITDAVTRKELELQKKLDKTEARVRELEDLVEEITEHRNFVKADRSYQIERVGALTKERDELLRALTIAEGFIDDSHLSSVYSKCVKVQRGEV